MKRVHFGNGETEYWADIPDRTFREFAAYAAEHDTTVQEAIPAVLGASGEVDVLAVE